MANRAVLVLLAMLTPWCARANDTSAALETGGLRFKQDPDIVMRSEDLLISEKQIRIVYRFFNTSAADKTIMIAFPMPDIVGTAADENIGIPTDDPKNMSLSMARRRRRISSRPRWPMVWTRRRCCGSSGSR